MTGKEGAPLPLEPTRAQHDMVTMIFGAVGFEAWRGGMFPASFTIPEPILYEMSWMYSLTESQRQERGRQLWWSIDEPGNLVKGFMRVGDEYNTPPQSIGQRARLIAGRTPTIDIHTHPYVDPDEEPARHRWNQFPAPGDISLLSGEPHLIAVFVSSQSGYTAAIKSCKAVVTSGAEPDIDKYDARYVVSTNMSAREYRHLLAASLPIDLGLYVADGRETAEMSFVPRKRQINRTSSE